MIPTIEDILRDLRDDQIALSKAIALIQTHIDTAVEADALRDHFAGLAMAPMLDLCQQDAYGDNYLVYCAKNSYLMADAMMEARV